jgi:hypothetical protein
MNYEGKEPTKCEFILESRGLSHGFDANNDFLLEFLCRWWDNLEEMI